MNPTLRDLAELTRMTPALLRARVPFGDVWVGRQVRLRPAQLRDRLAHPERGAGDAADRRIAAFLLPWVYEGAVGEVPTCYVFRTLALDAEDDGHRLGILCPGCNREYMLGSVHPYLILPTDKDERKLVFYHGVTVQCPEAQEGRCAAPKEVWQPRLVWLRHRAGPGASLDRLLLEVPGHARLSSSSLSLAGSSHP